MSWAITIGTTSAHWIDQNPIPDGCVVFDGDLPKYPIWDSGINNIREMTDAEVAAAAPPDIPGFISAVKAALGGIVAVTHLARAYPLFLDAVQQGQWADVKALVQDALATGVLSPAQVTAILGIAMQYHIPIPA